jgi:hypothetical protein
MILQCCEGEEMRDGGGMKGVQKSGHGCVGW